MVVATGNGTAGYFTPGSSGGSGSRSSAAAHRLDYVPALQSQSRSARMLHDMAHAVRIGGGSGARLSTATATAAASSMTRAREDLRRQDGRDPRARPDRALSSATFVTDVKSTGLFASDPALDRQRRQADYWRDRPQPHHEAPGPRSARWRVREIRPLFSRRADRPQLRLRHAGRGRGLQADGPQSRQSRCHRTCAGPCRRTVVDPDALALLPRHRNMPRSSGSSHDRGPCTARGASWPGGRSREIVTVSRARIQLGKRRTGFGARLIERQIWSWSAKSRRARPRCGRSSTSSTGSCIPSVG